MELVVLTYFHLVVSAHHFEFREHVLLVHGLEGERDFFSLDATGGIGGDGSVLHLADDDVVHIGVGNSVQRDGLVFPVHGDGVGPVLLDDEVGGISGGHFLGLADGQRLSSFRAVVVLLPRLRGQDFEGGSIVLLLVIAHISVHSSNLVGVYQAFAHSHLRSLCGVPSLERTGHVQRHGLEGRGDVDVGVGHHESVVGCQFEFHSVALHLDFVEHVVGCRQHVQRHNLTLLGFLLVGLHMSILSLVHMNGIRGCFLKRCRHAHVEGLFGHLKRVGCFQRWVSGLVA